VALFNEIQAGRFNRFCQKFFSMKGSAVTPQLTNELSMTIPFSNGVENRVLESMDTFWATANVIANAGLFSRFRFRNPAGSGVMAAIQKMSVVSGNVDNIAFGTLFNGADLSTVFATQGIDGRGRPTSSCVPSIQAAATGVTPLYMVSFGGSAAGNISTYDFMQNENQELPVSPGQVIEVGSGTVNIALRVSVLWRERPIEDSEVRA
jgi:hypothetical protein